MSGTCQKVGAFLLICACQRRFQPWSGLLRRTSTAVACACIGCAFPLFPDPCTLQDGVLVVAGCSAVQAIADSHLRASTQC